MLEQKGDPLEDSRRKEVARVTVEALFVVNSSVILVCGSPDPTGCVMLAGSVQQGLLQLTMV